MCAPDQSLHVDSDDLDTELALDWRTDATRSALFAAPPSPTATERLERVLRFLHLCESRRLIMPTEEVCYLLRHELAQLRDAL